MRVPSSMPDVVLIQMPYASVERPSIALGTLQACLERAGIGARTVYANLRFAEILGLDGYESINQSAILHRIGEWTFAAAAFPHADLDGDAYLEAVTVRLGETALFPAQLLRVRAAADAFVEAMAVSVLALRPRIVGCSSTFQQQNASLALLRRIRARAPEVVTMLGGGNCEGEMGWTAHQSFEWVDFVVSGEADEVLAPLCALVLAGGREVPIEALGPGVFGPAHRDLGEATPQEADLFARVARMDRVPVPTYGDYFAELGRMGYRRRVRPGLTIETARGCWWGEKHHCSFCGISQSGMNFRAKPAAQVMAEIDTLEARHGIDRFVTADNIIERGYFKSLLPALAERGGSRALFYQTKANLKRREVASLADAGVRWIQPGIESLDDRVLGLLEKGASAAINLQLVKWARNHGIWLLWNMLFGAPGEDDAWYVELADWLPLIHHLQPPGAAEMTAIRYNRFSPYHQAPTQFGLDLVPNWAYRHTYPHDGARRARQAYYFTDRRDVAGSARPAARPGVVAVNAAIAEWTRLFVDDAAAEMPVMRRDAPVLVGTRDGDGLVVRDTRPCAVDLLHRLSAEETRVLRACDAAASSSAIAAAMAREGASIDGTRLDRILSLLTERGFVHGFGERVLSLVLDDPIMPYRDPLDFPAGLLLRAVPHTVAGAARNGATPSAWDIPVAALSHVFSSQTGPRA